MIKINDAYFGIVLPNINRGGELEPANLFNSKRVIWAIAIWKTKPEVRKDKDVISWCFSDTRGRAEYEWIVSPWPGPEGSSWKVDVYHMYVEPNRDILTKIVNDISVNSCREWLREHRR